jgi:hypothetical protein
MVRRKNARLVLILAIALALVAGGPPAQAKGSSAKAKQQPALKRFLYGVLACVELAVAANEHAEDPRRQPTQQVLDVNVRPHISTPPAPMSGRTSTAQ